MSRCFPFPPPGYEKKTRTDDLDLLKKEKEKEKKHKKEKKDKEKKECKVKRDKDRIEEKRRDTKHKKEKHREKKKNKDRDKDKDKSTNSDEKKLSGLSEDQNGEKRSYEETLARKSDFQFGEKCIQKEGREKEKINISGEKKYARQFAGFNGERANKNSNVAEDSQNSKFVKELDKRIGDEGRVGPQLAHKFIADPKKEEGMLRFKNFTLLAEQSEENNRSDSSRLDEQGFREETKTKGNVLAQNHVGAIQAQVVEMQRREENDVKRHVERKEKGGDREADVQSGNKHRNKYREKKGHGKVEDRGKGREKQKAKVEGEYWDIGLDNLKENAINFITSKLSVESNHNALAEGNTWKRKDTNRNELLPDNFIKSNTLPNPVSSSHTYSDSGTTSETSHSSAPPMSNRLGAATSDKVDSKVQKFNGIIEVQPLSASSTRSLSGNAQAGGEVPVKAPHPDLKYLSQVLSVPKMEELSEFSDQEWLFSCDESQRKKPKLGSTGVEETPQVWAEALLIEAADVYALPYVSPS